MRDCPRVPVSGNELASDILWSSVPDARLPVLIVGVAFALSTFALYGLLIHRHAVHGRRITRNDAKSVSFPEKLQYQQWMLYTGPLMVIFFLVQMFAPELTTMAELFQNTYRAFAYYFLLRFTAFQFGLPHNAIRDDGSGTMQQHEPGKIWNKPPCCCVWVFFLPFMTDRIVCHWDCRLIQRLTLQYCFVAPVAATLKMVVHYNGVKAEHAASVSSALNIIQIMSIMFAVYANRVYSAIAQAVPPIEHQLKQRSWFNHGKELGGNIAAAPNQNISVKTTWLSLATVPPSIAGIVVGRVVEGDICMDNGHVLLVQDRRNYIIAFISILTSFLAAVFAFRQAFPLPDSEDCQELHELIAMRYLELELWPAIALKNIPSSINGIIEERKSKGRDPNFGIPPRMWVESFGDCTVSGARASQSDESDGLLVSAAPIGATMQPPDTEPMSETEKEIVLAPTAGVSRKVVAPTPITGGGSVASAQKRQKRGRKGSVGKDVANVPSVGNDVEAKESVLTQGDEVIDWSPSHA